MGCGGSTDDTGLQNKLFSLSASCDYFYILDENIFGFLLAKILKFTPKSTSAVLVSLKLSTDDTEKRQKQKQPPPCSLDSLEWALALYKHVELKALKVTMLLKSKV